MNNIFKDNQAFNHGCHILVNVCADLKSNESALIISDKKTALIGEALNLHVLSITKEVQHCVVEDRAIHGQEPSDDTSRRMLSADVIFCLTRMSMAHTKARQSASMKGARFLSLPDYTHEVVSGNALTADFRTLTGISMQLAEMLSKSSTIRLITTLGTDIKFDITGRKANASPGWCYAPGTLASPPDAETNIAVREEKTQGTLVVDGSIPCNEMGLIVKPLTLTIEKGRVVKILGDKSDVLNSVFERVNDDKAKVAAEFGIGLNPKAALSGNMLEDEGTLGTVHIGIGSNITIGGNNNVAFHLDHVIRNATVMVDDVLIIKNGAFL